MSQPIIVRIESQEVVQEVAMTNGNLRVVIKNIGIAADGTRWRFYSDHITYPSGLIGSDPDYNFVQLPGGLDLHPDDAAALAEPGAPDGICPACGEIDCDQTCYAFLDAQFPPEPDWDGGECTHCHSTYTMRIDIIVDDPVVWACECFTCGKSFEVTIPRVDD